MLHLGDSRKKGTDRKPEPGQDGRPCTALECRKQRSHCLPPTMRFSYLSSTYLQGLTRSNEGNVLGIRAQANVSENLSQDDASSQTECWCCWNTAIPVFLDGRGDLAVARRKPCQAASPPSKRGRCFSFLGYQPGYSISLKPPPPWPHSNLAHGDTLQFGGYRTAVIIWWPVCLCHKAVSGLRAGSLSHSSLYPPHPRCNRYFVKLRRKFRYWEKY